MPSPEYTEPTRALQRAPQPPVSPPPQTARTVIMSKSDVDDVTLPLAHYLWILRRHIWNITAGVAAVVLTTAIVSLRLTPIYESTATLYVDRQEAKGVVGQESQAGNYSN